MQKGAANKTKPHDKLKQVLWRNQNGVNDKRTKANKDDAWWREEGLGLEEN